MRKTPTLFERDWDGDRSRVVNQINPTCQWVADGEGIATMKLDGMCCAIIDGQPFKRREFKKDKPLPDEFVLTEEDQQTGKRVGWMPIGDGPDDKYFQEGLARLDERTDGTYELVGPKSQGGVEKRFSVHEWVAHSTLEWAGEKKPPRSFNELPEWMADKDIEGIVWHHEDGRMAKIKLRDFGLKRAQ